MLREGHAKAQRTWRLGQLLQRPRRAPQQSGLFAAPAPSWPAPRLAGCQSRSVPRAALLSDVLPASVEHH